MFKTTLRLAATLASFLMAALPATAGEGCQPVDALKDTDSLPGKKAWIWADDERSMRHGPEGLGMAMTYREVGPDKWVIGDDKVPYGEPVEIVKHQVRPDHSGQTTVRTEDGRVHVVPGSTIKLYEFWKCPVTELLEDRFVIDRSGKFPQSVRRKIASTVWVRLIDKSTPVEQFGIWMKPEDVAKIDVMLCRQWTAPDQPKVLGQSYPLSCQPRFLKGWGPGLSLDPRAVELISPTSMKILLTN